MGMDMYNLFLAGEDYEDQMNTPIVFTPGSIVGESSCAFIPIVPDECVERNESFTFSLSSNDPVDFVGETDGIILIIDDDCKCQVSFLSIT